jgi:hypothetical protein
MNLIQNFSRFKNYIFTRFNRAIPSSSSQAILEPKATAFAISVPIFLDFLLNDKVLVLREAEKLELSKTTGFLHFISTEENKKSPLVEDLTEFFSLENILDVDTSASVKAFTSILGKYQIEKLQKEQQQQIELAKESLE